jgi:hypothetical protein
VTVHGQGDEVAAYWARLGSPETYLGYERTERLASPGGLGVGANSEFSAPDR